MGKRSKSVRERLLVWTLSLAMLLTGVTMPTGTRKAQAADEIVLSIKSGGSSGTDVSMAANQYAADPSNPDYIYDVYFNIPEQAKTKALLASNAIKSIEVKVTVNDFSVSSGTPAVMIFAQPGEDGGWNWNQSDGSELKKGQQLTLKYDFTNMNWNGGSDFGNLGIRFANTTSAGKVSYTINSAKMIMESGSSGGSGNTGENQTDWEVQNSDLKLSYTAEDQYDAYTEYKFMVQNNGSGSVSGDLVVTFDQIRKQNWWTGDYSISLTNGNKAVQVSNLSVPAGGSVGPIQIQLEPLGAKITSVTFAGKTIAAELSSGSGGGSTINPDLDLEYNFAKAFQYSLYLYDANMCGPEVKGETAFTWRGNCHLEDQTMSYNGKTVDVSGGYHDAGDHVKFNLPQAYSASTLGIGYYEFKDAFTELGQDDHMKIIMDRFAEYFENCTILDSSGKVEAYCYQVGDGGPDHDYWGPPEEQTSRQGARSAYFTSSSTPCTDIVGETAAALAIYAVNYKEADQPASDRALKYAKALFEYAESNAKGLSSNSNAAGFYNGSRWEDDMALASIWLYKATGDSSYQSKYNTYVQGCQTGWVMSWDDVSAAAYLYGGKADSTRTIINNQKSKVSPQGFAYVDGSWGSARYNTALQLMGLSVDKENNTSDYQAWALGQMQYLMGSNKDKRNYIVGYNENSPQCIHHRAASGYGDVNANATTPLKYTVYGALAGGPNANDVYIDRANEYQYAEVAIDYNAGFVGALAGLYLQEKDGQFKDEQQLVTSKTGEMKDVSIYYGEETVDPNATPHPTRTPKPSSSATPGITIGPNPTPTPGSSTGPNPTPTPGSSTGPNPTLTPGTTTGPNPTPTPGTTTGPNPTPTPGTTTGPNPTPTPGTTTGPNPTPTPGTTTGPNPTPTLSTTTGPNPTPTPGSSTGPNPTLTPGTTIGPNPTPTPGTTTGPNPTSTPGSSTGPNVTSEPGSSDSPSWTLPPGWDISSPTPAPGGQTPTPGGDTPIPSQTPAPGGNPIASDTPGSTNPPGSTNDPYASQSPQASAAPGTGSTGVITDPSLAISSGWSGVDAALAEQIIISQKSDKDIAGSAFGALKLRATKTAKNSVKLKWNAVAGASKYIVYGNRCGKNNTMQKLATVTGTSWTHKGLKKGTYYKYLVTACQTINGVDVTLGISKTVHTTTLGGKKGNVKKVTVKKAKVALKKGKSFKIKAKQVPLKKKNKIANHRKISYESSNQAIATVSSSGKIKAKKKGKCIIYVYAQNGIYKQIKVTVK